MDIVNVIISLFLCSRQENINEVISDAQSFIYVVPWHNHSSPLLIYFGQLQAIGYCRVQYLPARNRFVQNPLRQVGWDQRRQLLTSMCFSASQFNPMISKGIDSLFERRKLIMACGLFGSFTLEPVLLSSINKTTKRATLLFYLVKSLQPGGRLQYKDANPQVYGFPLYIKILRPSYLYTSKYVLYTETKPDAHTILLQLILR